MQSSPPGWQYIFRQPGILGTKPVTDRWVDPSYTHDFWVRKERKLAPPNPLNTPAENEHDIWKNKTTILEDVTYLLLKNGDFPVTHVRFFVGGEKSFFSNNLLTSASAGAGAVCPWRFNCKMRYGQKHTLRMFNSSPLESYLPNRKVVFQPSFFRGYVKLLGGTNEHIVQTTGTKPCNMSCQAPPSFCQISATSELS